MLPFVSMMDHVIICFDLYVPCSMQVSSVSPANPYPDMRLHAIPNIGNEYRDYWDNIFICLLLVLYIEILIYHSPKCPFRLLLHLEFIFHMILDFHSVN